MLLRTSLSATGALLLASGAFAQTDATHKLAPTVQPKDAGIYHLATGTWTRAKSPIAMIGTDVLYDNTCTVGIYLGASVGESFVDAIRLPSTSSPTNSTSITGSSNTYEVDGFQIAYCTGETNMDLDVAFYQAYAQCSDVAAILPTSNIATLAALPGIGGGTGSLACWFVTIDLDLTTEQFNMLADADGTFDGTASLDTGGWSFTSNTAQASGVAQGPITAGDPFGLTTGTACAYGDGTFWSGNTNTGTGLGTDDAFESNIGGAINACFFLGGYLSGNPYSSLYMQIIGDAAGTAPPTGTQYCAGDGNGTACPCGNNNDGSANGGMAGCGNSVNNAGSVLSAAGNPSVGGDTVVFTADGLQNNQPGIFFRADNAVNGGAGITFGDGLRCAGGNVVRLGVFPANGSGVATSAAGIAGAGLTAGDVKRYQYWYRNPGGGGGACGNAFNLSNGFEITWGA